MLKDWRQNPRELVLTAILYFPEVEWGNRYCGTAKGKGLLGNNLFAFWTPFSWTLFESDRPIQVRSVNTDQTPTICPHWWKNGMWPPSIPDKTKGDGNDVSKETAGPCLKWIHYHEPKCHSVSYETSISHITKIIIRLKSHPVIIWWITEFLLFIFSEIREDGSCRKSNWIHSKSGICMIGRIRGNLL